MHFWTIRGYKKFKIGIIMMKDDEMNETNDNTKKERLQQFIHKKPLRVSVQEALRNYLPMLPKKKNNELGNLYDLVLAEVEAPMLDIIMQHTRGNQTEAARIMGINRGTLRKKLKFYGMN
jgi:Fis family transcriptional regulator, factor for inversion stimulation protein